MKNLILIVIYNTNIYESETIKSLLDSKVYLANSHLFIWDNSQESQNISVVKSISNHSNIEFTYEHHPENLPLSKAYNKVINQFKNENYDFLVLLDQDSSFKKELFIKLDNTFQNNKEINLFLPIIKFKNTIVSPTKKYFLKGFYFKEKPFGIQKAKNISAINSGMIISFKFLKEKYKGYDERLKFYGTDDYFMMEYCKNEKELFILDYEFEHDLTLSTLNNSSDKLVKSYHQMLEAWSILYSDSILKYIVKLYTYIHSSYIAIKYKNKDFLIWKK